MAITATARGTGGNNTAALTLVCSPSTTIGANSMGVLVIAVDNAGSAGSTAIAPTSITDSVGNTWTLRRDDVFDNGAASAGAEIVIYTGWVTTQITSSDNVTVDWNGTVQPTAKAYAFWEVDPTSGWSIKFETGGTNSGGTTGTPTVTTSSVTNGWIVIGGGAAESASTWTGDNDATNGTWSSQQAVGYGTGTSGMSVTTQYKVVSATATQTYNPTLTSADCILSWVALSEYYAGSGSFTASSVIKRTEAGSFSASAVVKKTESVTFSADAVLKKTASGSFSAEAVLQASVGVPTWVSPADGVNITPTPTLVFTMPNAASNMYFHIQLDKVNTFNGVDLRNIKSHVDQTGWEYYNGATWVAVPAGGVPNTYSGNDCRYTVQTALSNGTWYRRVRVGV